MGGKDETTHRPLPRDGRKYETLMNNDPPSPLIPGRRLASQ